MRGGCVEEVWWCCCCLLSAGTLDTLGWTIAICETVDKARHGRADYLLE